MTLKNLLHTPSVAQDAKIKASFSFVFYFVSLDMKTVRINHTNSTQLLPIINASCDSAENGYNSPGSKSGIAQSITNIFTNETNNNNIANSPVTSSASIVSPIKTTSLNSPQTAQQQEQSNQLDSTATTNTNGAASGLVRRLSVTARPGDIFYKVKDVTESCSTTDTISVDQSVSSPVATVTSDSLRQQSHMADEHEQEIIIKSPSSQNSAENGGSDSASQTSPKSGDPSTTLGRKTTTWNVRRNQTTSLGITPPLGQPQQNATSSNDKIFKAKLSSKDDASLDTINASSVCAEPGSPNFTKELLSIR